MKTEIAKPSAADQRRSAIEASLDHALEETFPASDPTAVSIEAVTVAADEPKSRAKTEATSKKRRKAISRQNSSHCCHRIRI